MASELEKHFLHQGVTIDIEKETGRDGNMKTGIWTRNKANLVHLAQMLIANDLVSFSNSIVTIGKCLQNPCAGTSLLREPNQDDEKLVMEALLTQLRDFKRSIKVDGKLSFSGKGTNKRDDLAMAFVLWLAWSCFNRCEDR